MKVSLNWARFINQKYGCAAEPAPDGVDALVERIGTQLGAVEHVEDLGRKYQGVVVVKVVSQQKHPNADKLQVVLIDDGRAVKNVRRGKDGYIQVVHGAPNVNAGMLAAWIPPGTAVPNTLDKEPFIIEARDIRGVASNGMLASTKELGLGDDHTGILEIDEQVKPGTQLAQVYNLDDYIIDIENKMFTHRPDCFGMLGIARELAGIQHKPFKSPTWYREDAGFDSDGRKNVLKLNIKNELPKLVSRFTAVAMKDVKVQESPVWLKVRLSNVGIRPINNIVDLTNFLMLETAQPIHAYDYDKVCNLIKPKAKSQKPKIATLGVRMSKKGETLKLLGGKEIVLNEATIVITDGHRPIGLGGVMGGEDTEVNETTRNIIIEVANFDMNLIRKVAREYGLFTEAATRFAKNQSPRQTKAVLIKAVNDIRRIAGGRVASPIIDNKHFRAAVKTITTDAGFINQRLGLSLTTQDIKQLLENVEFIVKVTGGIIEVTCPFWRTDIEIAEDVVEEVGRLYGYDKLPTVLPPRNLSPAELNPLLSFKSHLRSILTAAGANEVLTYSFVHGSLIQKTGQDPKFAYKIRNALSPDLQYYRLGLMPSLLEKVHPNIKAGNNEFALFEIGKVHTKERGTDAEGLPIEDEFTALVVASRYKPSSGAAYFGARKYLEYLTRSSLELKPLTPGGQKYQIMRPYLAERSALVSDQRTGKFLGIIGEFDPAVAAGLKLPPYCAGFELDTMALQEVMTARMVYRPLNRFPSTEQDLTLHSQGDIPHAELAAFLDSQLMVAAEDHGYGYKIAPLDIYQPPKQKYKRTTWRLTLWHPERTLTTNEVNQLLDKIAKRAKAKLGAIRI